MKKFLKGFGVFFFSLGIVVYTVTMFEQPNLFPGLLFMDLLFIFFIYLILRKRKPKSQVKAPEEPTLQVQSNLNPEAAIQSMAGAYTIAEAKNHVRILQDCLDIFEKTKNLETFFSRYEYGMQIACTLDQAAKAKIIPMTTDFPTTFSKAADSQKERVLIDSFGDQKEKIDRLKTDKAKISHWKRYLDTLSQFEDQYDFNLDSKYPLIVEQVQREITNIDPLVSVQNSSVSND